MQKTVQFSGKSRKNSLETPPATRTLLQGKVYLETWSVNGIVMIFSKLANFQGVTNMWE